MILLLLLFVGHLPTSSQEASTPPDDAPALNFVVWTRSGEKVAYRLLEHPVVTALDNKLLLTTRENVVEYTASDVKKFTIEPLYYFVAWLTDGSRYAYALGEHPVVTYSNDELLLTTKEQQVTYSASEVHKFTFSLSDITYKGELPPSTAVSSQEQHPLLDIRHGDIFLSGCRPGSVINVYGADGKHLQTVSANDNGNASLSTVFYPSGVYIIKTETITHKIIKR